MLDCTQCTQPTCFPHVPSCVIVNSSTWIRTSRQRPCKLGQAYLTSLLLILASDVELNPGPSSNFLCGTCSQPVTWEQEGVLCDECETWYHTTGQNIGSNTYDILSKHESYSWACTRCGILNHSSNSLFDLVVNEHIQQP